MNSGKKYKTLTLNTILFTVSSFGSKFISFLFLPLYTSVLSTEDYGKIEILTATVQLLIPILTVGIQDAVLRYSLDKEYRPQDVISSGIQVILAGFSLLCAGVLAGRAAGLIRLERQYLLFVLCYYFIGASLNTLSMYLRAMDKIRLIVCASLLNTVLICALNVLFLVVLRLGITGYLLANIIATALNVTLLFFAGGVYREVRFRLHPLLLKTMARYSFPLAFGSLAWWVNNVSDRYIVTLFCGLDASGVYSIAYKIPTILATIQGVFYNAWSVSAITNYDSADSDGFIGTIYSMYSALSAIACSCVLLGNIFLARLLYAKDFFGAWHYVPLLLLGTTFNGLALFEGCIFTAAKQSGEVAKTTVTGACVNTALNFILIYTMGPIGAAVATMAGYFSIWLFRTVKLRHIISMKVNWPLQCLWIAFLSLQTCLASAGEVWLQIPCLVMLCCLHHKSLNVFRKAVMKKTK